MNLPSNNILPTWIATVAPRGVDGIGALGVPTIFFIGVPAAFILKTRLGGPVLTLDLVFY